jgi:hypothetical protein
MIFACSIGTKGSTDVSYSIHLPLEFSPGRKFSFEENCFYGKLDGLELNIEKHHYLYSIKISDFESEEDAKNYINRILASLRWVSLKYNIGIKIPQELHEVRFYKEPILVTEKSILYELAQNAGWDTLDGVYDVDKLTVIPEHKRLNRWENGKVNITLGLKPELFLGEIKECLSFPNIEEIINNNKLCVAIELYSAYSFEVTSTGKFVKLVTVLESLLPETEISKGDLSLLNKAKDLMKGERKSVKESGGNTESIDRLINRVRELSKQSIGYSIEFYVSSLFAEFPDLGNAEEIIPRLKSAYNVRSRLLHDGEADESVLNENIGLLADLIPKILTKLFLRCAT